MKEYASALKKKILRNSISTRESGDVGEQILIF
jgi:hypothetical protein